MPERSAHPPKTLSALGFLLTLVLTYAGLSNLQRLAFWVWIVRSTHTWPERPLAIFGKGLVFDLASAAYILAPVTLMILVSSRRRFSQSGWRAVALVMAVLPLTVAVSGQLCEFLFFDEFHARYNFIAVDYLVYTNEVIHNVLESYSIFALSLVALVPALMWFLLIRRLLQRMAHAPALAWPQRVRFGVLLGLLAICAVWPAEDSLLANESFWTRELAKNSMFALFSAYNRNSINFKEFYSNLDEETAFALTHDWLAQNSKDATFPDPSGSLDRQIVGHQPEHRWNVVLVAMESMSARFLGHFGNTQPITPNLDRLADEGLFFTQLYATGTRTVRGLEALMLSLPPTPGQSILRRPNSDHLFNLGTVFAERGYENQFVYGGYAYFDNMKEWFESNGFGVVDRAQFPADEIHFGNAWGVCDEDLFAQVLQQQQQITSRGKPFFQVVLTTSNHRPYTFPEGRIDIPSHTGREGAIKYSDYAIGKFITDLKTKPWAKDTIVIFVADHDASVAGGVDIPVRDYLIPAIIYNPNLIPKQKIDKVTSQIDLAPTILGLLGFSYRSRFFGSDALVNPEGQAFLGTYQKVAMLTPPRLHILAPGRRVEMQALDKQFGPLKAESKISASGADLPLDTRRAIAIYQMASRLFSEGRLKISGPSN